MTSSPSVTRDRSSADGPSRSHGIWGKDGSASTSRMLSNARSRSSMTPPCRRWEVTGVARCSFWGSGTGLGSALVVDGIVGAMELGHLPYKKATFEDYVGIRGLERYGKRKWQRYVADVVKRLVAAIEPDEVVLGGGNVRNLKELPPGCRTCRTGDNANAFLGGFRLWSRAVARPLSVPQDDGSLKRDRKKETNRSTRKSDGNKGNKMSNYKQQLQKMKTQPGFIAALDQSGGSTPKALSLYGIREDAWSNEDEMFAIVHQMRTRLITSLSFTGERILGAILFENTMDRDIEGSRARTICGM